MKIKQNYIKMRKAFFIFALMILIFCFSAQTGGESLQLSDRVVHFIESIFSDTIVSGWLIDLSFLVRKSTHFLIYFVLGIFSYSFFKAPNRSWQKVMFFSLLLCFFYACTDEVHQLFVVGRTGRVLDVFIDSCGAFLSILILTIYRFYKAKKVSR